MKNCVSLGFLACAAPILVSAQDRSLDFAIGKVDTCNETRAYIGLNYSNVKVSPRGTLRFLSEVCIARDHSWFVGPDTVTGFTETIAFPGAGGMYEVIEEASVSHGRSRLTVGPAEVFPFDIGIDILFYHVALNATAAGPMPQADFIAGQGHGVDSNLEQLSSLPNGRWLTYIYPIPAVQLTQHQVDFGNAELGQTPIILTVNNDVLASEQIAPAWAENRKWQNIDLKVDIADGTLSASLSFEYTNPKLVEARGPIEYDFATIEMTEVIGRAVSSTNGGVIVGQGSGRISAQTQEGSEHIFPAWFDLVAARIPESMSDAELEAYLKGQ